jgi:hypothetical protein
MAHHHPNAVLRLKHPLTGDTGKIVEVEHVEIEPGWVMFMFGGSFHAMPSDNVSLMTFADAAMSGAVE